MATRTTKPVATNPNSVGNPNNTVFDQMTIMQSLTEIQKDMATLNERTSHLSEGLRGLGSDMEVIKRKIGRAEGIGVGVIAVLVIVGGVIWFFFGEPISYLRDELVNQHPQINLPPPPSATSPASHP